MGAGEDGDRWWSGDDPALATPVPPDDVAARTAAAARAFAALRLTDRGEAGAARPPTRPAGRPAAAAEPVRPDAILWGRRFAPVDADRGPEARTERRRAFDERRQAHGAPVDDEAASRADEPRPAGPPSPAAGQPTPHARRRDRVLLHLLALAVASGALVAPVTWPVAVALAALAGAAGRSAADHGAAPGPFVRRAVRRGASWLRPRSLLWAPVLAARTVLIAVALPALAWAARWLAAEGTEGSVAAARAGVWADGFRVVSAVVCFMLVTGVGDARDRRAAQVHRALAGRGPAVAVALAGAATAVTIVAVAVAPRLPAGAVTGTDGLAWVPGALHGTVDGFRDDVVVAEIQSASECLSAHQGVAWHPGYTRANGAGDDDVARLSAEGDDPSDADLSTAGLALHDVLAPWVDTIVLEVGGVTVLAVDRHTIAGARPLTDATDLTPAAVTGRTVVEGGAAGVDRTTVLACASALLP